MNPDTLATIQSYMKKCMTDSAHDLFHIYRVLNYAKIIAVHEQSVDDEILTTACLLHDIGRQIQFQSPNLCHAEEGAKMANSFLLDLGWKNERAAWVASCIYTHRFRANNPPESIEAKILFDADKLDVTGAIGIARTLLYKGQVYEPIYTLNQNNTICTSQCPNSPESFIKEYNFKLKKLYNHFYTKTAKTIALSRQPIAEQFFNPKMHITC